MPLSNVNLDSAEVVHYSDMDQESRLINEVTRDLKDFPLKTSTSNQSDFLYSKGGTVKDSASKVADLSCIEMWVWTIVVFFSGAFGWLKNFTVRFMGLCSNR